MREARERDFQPGLFDGPKELPIELPPPMPAPVESRLVYVTLDPEEQDAVEPIARKVAARYARGRDEEGRPAEMKWTLDADKDPIAHFRQSLGAEMAVAAWTGLPWNRGVRGKADVGHNVEARQTAYEPALLVLKDFDKLERLFVLCVGRWPSYRLAGWIPGHEGAGMGRPFFGGEAVQFVPGGRRRTSKNGGWILPESKLRPMHELEVRR